MADGTTKLETAITDAASKAGIDSSTIAKAESTVDRVVADSRSLFDKAQEAVAEAVGTVVEAVKENPVRAAGIAAGATVAVAGAAYGASKLVGSSDDRAKPKRTVKKKA